MQTVGTWCAGVKQVWSDSKIDVSKAKFCNCELKKIPITGPININDIY